MNCSECRRLVAAHVDGELELVASLEVEAHLATCAACAAEAAALRELSSGVRANASRSTPSAEFERRLRASIGAQSNSPAPIRRRRVLATGLVIGLASAAALFVAAYAGFSIGRPSRERMLLDEVVALHVRSTLTGHLIDVASSDRHTVNPWFQGKLPFAVGARDFADRGFALEGGRLDYVDRRPVAALVYRHGPHVVTLVVSKDDGDDRAPRRSTSSGYTAIDWQKDGLERWAVSDVDLSALEEFVELAQSGD